ncbi:hypothetical protein GGR52DRAFT_4696 [Hypoxylon sp. FL1284]|nr:hypothetical protein GGR52DRAFT_4696 [Hypoxylon sp. FL1284]
MSAPFRLTLPASLQRSNRFTRFTRFEDFPLELRLQIWKDAVDIPGIHFLKFEDREISAQATAYIISLNVIGTVLSQAPGATIEEKRAYYTASLKPLFPTHAADMSHFIAMNKIMTELSLICKEAKMAVRELVSRPGNLTLHDDRLISLKRSTDVVCFDYPGAHGCRSLRAWADYPDPDQLASVRRVAVRYSPHWDKGCRTCRKRGTTKGSRHDHSSATPRHVVELAAIFKNLEVFYLIDYLAVRNERDHSVPLERVEAQKEHGEQGDRFATAQPGRTYFEIKPEECKVHTHVFQTLSWVKRHYDLFCETFAWDERVPSKSVQFKVLGCEWDDAQGLVAAPIKHRGPKPERTSSKRRSRASNPSKGTKNHGVAATPTPDTTLYDGILPVVFGDGGKSKFDFTFRMPASVVHN